MSVLMICGSPHDKGGNSTYLLEGLKEMLSGDAVICNAILSADVSEAAFINAVKNGDNIVLAFPLYADSLPAHFLAFLQRVQKAMAGIVSQSHVYMIVQNGFIDDFQNSIAVKIVWKWCEKCGLRRGQAIALGGGGMTQAAPIGKGPFAKAGVALEKLAENIKYSKSDSDFFTKPSFPKFMYKIAANMVFTRQAKENGLSRADIRKHINA